MRTYTRLAPCHAAAIFCLFLFTASITFAQTTAFTYQGKLTDAGNPANGNYDLQFRLFDALVSGNQVGATIVREDVPVANGIFTTTLDFGALAFNGANRFLEIAVRPGASTGAFTSLAPLQPVTATPYALMSLNAGAANNLSASCVLCVADAQIAAVSGNKVSGTVANATNSVNAANAINATNFSGILTGDVTGTQSATSVIALRGKGIAATAPTNGQVLKFSAANNQYEPAPDNNAGGTITGVTAGTGLNGGGTSGNVALGLAAGGVGAIELANNAVTAAKIAAGQVVKSLNGLTDGVTLAAGNNITITPSGNTLTIAAVSSNAILNQTTLQAGANFNISGNGTSGGILSGNIVNTATQYNIGGSRILSAALFNLFAGVDAGSSNTTGDNNTFFGTIAGRANTTGSYNSFFGLRAGQSNTDGNSNAFFGSHSGDRNVAGSYNAFFGIEAGLLNTIGNGNAFFGYRSGLNNTGDSNAFFGKTAGFRNTTGSGNAFFGNAAGFDNTTGGGNAFFGDTAGYGNTTGSTNAFFGSSAGVVNTTGSENAFFGALAGLHNTTGSENAFFGTQAGLNHTTGIGNTFIGYAAGFLNTTGNLQTYIGTNANSTNGLTNVTAIGAQSFVTQSNSLVLGNINGINGATADTSVSIGTTAPSARLHVIGEIKIGGTGNGLRFPDGTLQTTAAVGGVTSVSASAPLASSGGITPNLSLSGVVPIANGGTGISSSPNAAGQFLRSSGAGAWAVGGIQASDLPSNSASYIQNTSTQQANANFNIGGDGTAGGTLSGNIVNATTQYNFKGNPVLSITGISLPDSNTFVGIGAGTSTTPSPVNNQGHLNSFFGWQAGYVNTTGQNNAFFGDRAGLSNTTGFQNAFFGSASGKANTSGYNNAFFGNGAGLFNTTGIYNSFFGTFAGRSNTQGDLNALFGYLAGYSNTTGGSNSFFGSTAGYSNTTGYSNAFYGSGVGYANTTGFQNAFYGGSTGQANTTGYNNAFFGYGAGSANTSGDSNAFFGNAAGLHNTTGWLNAFFGVSAGAANTTGIKNAAFGVSAGSSNTTGSLNTYIGAGANSVDGLSNATAIGSFAYVEQSNSLVLGSLSGVNGAMSNTSVGIGTTAPKAKLDVTGGDILVGSPGQGIILKSPDGTKCTKLSVDNTGSLQVTVLMGCP